MKRLNLFFFCLLTMIALAGNAQEKQADANGYIVKVGEQAPDFTVKSVQPAWQGGDAPVYGQLVWRVSQGDAIYREGHLAEAQG